MLHICSECKHFLPLDVAYGLCRRYPPAANGQSFLTPVYPKVEKDFAACGEFKEKDSSTPNTKNTANKGKKK